MRDSRVINNTLTKKSQEIYGFTDKVSQIFKEEIIPKLFTLPKNGRKKEYFLIHSIKVSISLINIRQRLHKKTTDQDLS